MIFNHLKGNLTGLVNKLNVNRVGVNADKKNLANR